MLCPVCSTILSMTWQIWSDKTCWIHRSKGQELLLQECNLQFFIFYKRDLVTEMIFNFKISTLWSKSWWKVLMPLNRNTKKQNKLKTYNFLKVSQRFMSIPNMQNRPTLCQHPQKFQPFQQQLKSKISSSKLSKSGMGEILSMIQHRIPFHLWNYKISYGF